MTSSKLTTLHEPGALSRIGGAAQGGSAKPPQEREKEDRQHGLDQQENPAARSDANQAPASGAGSGGASETEGTTQKSSGS
jgi:hypothetical protein